MQGWMIALIVIASVILFISIVMVAAGAIMFHAILGRRGEYTKGDSPETYGVDISWYEKDEIKAAKSQLELTAFDGITLRAMYLKHPETDGPVKKVAVVQHGYWATPRSVQPYAQIFFDRGYDVIMPAARGHDISDGKYVGMGWLDRFDYMRWVDKAIELYGKDVSIAMMGISMGGATVIGAAGMEPPPQVKCVIDDCGFSSQKGEYFSQVRKAPEWLKYVLMFPMDMAVRIKCGYSVYDADFTKLAEKMTIPALFFHGENDKFVPTELGKKMYEACGSEDKNLIITPGAVHANSVAVDREGYTKAFGEFIDKYIE